MWDHYSEHSRQPHKRFELSLARRFSQSLKDLMMYILRAFAFLLLLAQLVLAEQPTPILPDAKLTNAG